MRENKYIYIYRERKKEREKVREGERGRECERKKSENALNETLNYDDLLLRYKEESRVAGND